jgi:predicted transcriptional regulator
MNSERQEKNICLAHNCKVRVAKGEMYCPLHSRPGKANWSVEVTGTHTDEVKSVTQTVLKQISKHTNGIDNSKIGNVKPRTNLEIAYDAFRLWIGDPQTRIPKLIVIAGLTLIAAPWWQPILNGLAVKWLNVDQATLDRTETTLLISGWCLVMLGVYLYVHITRNRVVSSSSQKVNQEDKKVHTIGKIIESLKNITAPNEALSINEISERVGLDIPTATHFLNQLKASNIVNGPYIMGEGRRYLLTDLGFQIYYDIKKSRTDDSKLNLPKWLTGEDVMRYYNLSSDLLMQYVRKGLPVYPAGEDVIFFDEEVPPLNEEDLAFEIDNNHYSNYRFRKLDIERFIKGENT